MNKVTFVFALMITVFATFPSFAGQEICREGEAVPAVISSHEVIEYLEDNSEAYQTHVLAFEADGIKGSRPTAFAKMVTRGSLFHQLLSMQSGDIDLNKNLDCSTFKGHLEKAIEGYARAYRIFHSQFLNGFDYDLDLSNPSAAESINFCNGNSFFVDIRAIVFDAKNRRSFDKGLPPAELAKLALHSIDKNVAYELLKVETVRLLNSQKSWFSLPLSVQDCRSIQAVLVKTRMEKLGKLDQQLSVADQNLGKIIATIHSEI